MERDYDVIIVGGGPAGATTALYARRFGLRVLLVDKRRFPRDKICGDAVARKSLGYLRDLGLLDKVLAEVHEPIGKAVLGAPNGTTIHFDLTEKHSGDHQPVRPHIVCRREIFDNVLIDATRTEVDVIDGCAVTDVLIEDGFVRGIECRHRDTRYGGMATRRISAGVVVGADGFNSIVARKLGVYRYDTSRWFVATRAYYRGLDCQANTAEIHFLDQTLPGFLWMFPTGDDVTNVGLGMIPRDIDRRNLRLRDVHEAAVGAPRFRARFQRAERIGDVRGWNIPTPDFTRTIHGSGFVLVGDAAGLADPFSGEGIGNAMGSGSIAARVAARAVETGDFGAVTLGEYPRQLWRELEVDELRLHYGLRKLARRRRLIDFLIARAAKHRDIMEWLTGMTAGDDAVARKRELTSPWTYLRLLARSKKSV
jgi:geranylgeranyl reductase family protein